MSPKKNFKNRIKQPGKSSGFTLLMSVFILVILALGAGYVVQIGLLAKETSLATLMRERAYFAAQSGLEWGLYQALQSSNCVAQTAIALPNTSVLAGFTASVTCSSQSYTEGADTYTIYTITSTGSRGSLGSVDYVSRQLSVSASSV